MKHTSLKRKKMMVMSRYRKKTIMIWSLFVLMLIYYLYIKLRARDLEWEEWGDDVLVLEEGVDEKDEIVDHLIMAEDFYQERNHINTTVLGDILFKNVGIPPRRSKKYKILIWKAGPFLESRHYYSFTATRKDPFAQCSVDNCIVSYEEGDLKDADAVVFHLQRLDGVDDLPGARAVRPSGQRWIYLTDECPIYTFQMQKARNLTQYVGVFNWSMTYRLESDVPVPYARVIPLEKPIIMDPALSFEEKYLALVPNATIKRRDVLAAVMTSHCNPVNGRMRYINDLQKHMTVHIYGGCGTEFKHLCPQTGKGKNSLYGGLCPELDRYHFYLAFENANCKQYFTEKAYWNGLRIGAIPIMMGPTNEDCKMMLPPKSYLNVRDFPTPKDLADYLLNLNNTWGEDYLKYHYWRNNFEAKNEHGYFGAPSVHYCRVCEALNYNNEEPKILNDVSYLLSIEENCFGYEWQINN